MSLDAGYATMVATIEALRKRNEALGGLLKAARAVAEERQPMTRPWRDADGNHFYTINAWSVDALIDVLAALDKEDA